MASRRGWAVGVLAIALAVSAAPAAADDAVQPPVVITSTTGPITGFPLQVTGVGPTDSVFALQPSGDLGATCRVFDGIIEHLGTGRTCVLRVLVPGDEPQSDRYSAPTTITFTGRYPTAFDGLLPEGFAQSMDYPLRLGTGWLISTDHAASIQLPPITGEVEVSLNGVPQPPLALTTWSFVGSGVVNIEARYLAQMPTGPYRVTYSYAGDSFHEPTTVTRTMSYVPNRFQPVGKKPPKRPHSGRPARPS